MKRLSEYTKIELSALSTEALETVIEIEAMVAGVSKPEPLPPMEYQLTTPPGGVQVWLVAVDKDYGGPVYWPQAFKCEEDAKQLSELATKLALGTYAHSSYGRSSWDPTKTGQPFVSSAIVPDDQGLKVWELQNKATLQANEVVRRRRSEVADEHTKWEAVADKVRTAWYSAQSDKRDAVEFFKVRLRFIELAGGDTVAAEKFLVEKYGAERVAGTLKEWGREFGVFPIEAARP